MLRATSFLAFAFTGLLFIGCNDLATAPELSSSDDAVGVKGETSANALRGKAVTNFVAPLSGDEVVPSVDTDARGLAKFKLNKAGDELGYKLIVANIEAVLGAHIHMAPPGENGGIVVFLFGDPFTDPVTVNGTLAEGTITASDVVGPNAGNFETLIEAMKAENTYVQVHTSENPPGEIRGQIDRGNGIRP
jgi:hypothetical protein